MKPECHTCLTWDFQHTLKIGAVHFAECSNPLTNGEKANNHKNVRKDVALPGYEGCMFGEGFSCPHYEVRK